MILGKIMKIVLMTIMISIVKLAFKFSIEMALDLTQCNPLVI